MSTLAANTVEPAPASRAPKAVLRRPEFWLSLLAHAALLSWLGWPTLRAVGLPAAPMDVYVVDVSFGETAGGEPPPEQQPIPQTPVATPPLQRAPSTDTLALTPVADLAPAPLPMALRAVPTAALVPATAPATTASAAVAEPEAEKGLALRLSEHLRRHQFYPRAARRAGIEGALLLRLRLDGEGRVLQASLALGSGYAVLDRAALELVSRAQPFPSPRQHAGLELVEIELPLDYRLATGALVAETP